MLDELNDAQAKAVTAGDGPLIIVAGPGTGKTKTLTARIGHLVQHGVAPEQILALTFTNKAAKEMQARVRPALHAASSANDALLMPDDGRTPRITTFHSLCYELLRDEVSLRLISEADRLELLRELRTAHAVELSLREISAKISWAKNALEVGNGDAAISTFLANYNAALHQQNRIDFDDLLQDLHAKLLNDAAFRTQIQRRWRYILVDEFQDTNELQYALLKLLASHDNFFVIGDPLQSIYGFRGASGDIFERFRRDFPAAEHIMLTANYRSTSAIVAISNELFNGAPKLQAQNKTVGTVEIVEQLNEFREAAWIVETIERDLGGTDFQRSHRVSGSERLRNFSDYAVLYRTHRVARALKRAFEESGVPFQSVGEDSPYTMRPLRTAIAALRLITFGSETLTPAELRLLAKIPKRKMDELQSQTPLVPTRFLESAAATLGLIKENNFNAMRQFHQALSTLLRFDSLGTKAFLAKFEELAEADFFDPNADAVALMTIHASKGLEFAHVFIIAAEDGVLPHAPKHAAHQSESPATLETTSKNLAVEDFGVRHFAEEKRLLYVAITRAREHLTLLHARTRAGQATKVSPFLAALSPKILPRTYDPNITAQTISAQKRKAKNSQGTLF